MFGARRPFEGLAEGTIARFQTSDAAEVQAAFRSQHGEDKYILSLMRDDDVPYVVDVGANDGYSWSNSYLFGKMGCRLLLIEPMPDYVAFARQHYPDDPKVAVVQAAVAKERGEASFFVNLDRERDLLAMGSSLRRDWVPSETVSEIKVRTAPLSDLLSENGCPREYFLLSVDCEGMDPVVIETAALNRFRARIVCIEEAIFGDQIPRMMARRGYERLTMLGPNGIYRRRRGFWFA